MFVQAATEKAYLCFLALQASTSPGSALTPATDSPAKILFTQSFFFFAALHAFSIFLQAPPPLAWAPNEVRARANTAILIIAFMKSSLRNIVFESKGKVDGCQ